MELLAAVRGEAIVDGLEAGTDILVPTGSDTAVIGANTNTNATTTGDDAPADDGTSDDTP